MINLKLRGGRRNAETSTTVGDQTSLPDAGRERGLGCCSVLNGYSDSNLTPDPFPHGKGHQNRARRLKSRLLVILVPTLIVAFALGVGFAQLPQPNPLVVPPLPPGPPPQLPAPITTAVAPSPLAVPTLPAAFSTPGPRTFNCTCSGPGTPTRWMGTVSASTNLTAEQSAVGACVSSFIGKSAPQYGTAGGVGAANFFGTLPGANQNAGAANTFGSPGVAQSSGSSTSLGSLPGATQGIGTANSFGGPGTGLSLSAAQQSRLCSQCVCT